MQFNARQYSSEAEIYEAVRALKYLHAAPVRRPVPELAVVPQIDPPLWQKLDIRFDAYIHAWGAWKALYERNAIRYLRARSIELGFTYPDLVIDDRRDSPVMARSILMWELKTYFNRSLAEIGRLFGGRDHSTVFYAIRKIERMKA